MPATATAPTVVCVLGMSRTGTSLTTRALNIAGVYLGPEEELLGKDLRQLEGEGESVLARARETNPEGFWEHYRMMRLNERILRALGGNWREPPELPSGWETSEALAAEREEARALVQGSFAGHDPWAWKDPRNCLTLPFWQHLLPGMRYVVCLRNPLDVAVSLRRRDGLALEQGVALWLLYLNQALANSAAGPRLFVPYESWFEDREATAARLAAFAGRAGAFEDAAAKRRLAAAVDERLWRNRDFARQAAPDPSVSSEALALHRMTERLAAAG